MGDCQYLSSLDTYLWPDIMAKLYVQKDTFQFKNRHLPKNQKYQKLDYAGLRRYPAFALAFG